MENKKELKFTIIFFAFTLLFFLPNIIYASTLSINPTSGTFQVGDKITVKVMVSTTEPINAISGTVSFPLSLFVIESISKNGSILNFWVTEPNFSKGAGTLSFEGVSLGGFKGGTGMVISAVLRATKAGSGTISFKSGQILANDGLGTDVTERTNGATLIVEAKEEIPIVPTEPIVEEEPIVDLPQEIPTLNSPEIILTNVFGEQAISGISDYANAKVLLTFIVGNGVKIFITSETDVNGNFVMLVPETLKHGIYKVSAVIIKEDFSNSLTSNEIIITIGNIFSDISLEIWIALIILILILLYFIIRSLIYIYKNKKFRLKIKKETKDVEDVLHKSFDILNEDINEEINKKITKSKIEELKEIKKDLHDAEELINKEVKDIKKL